jgi:hypothetical protein
MARDGLDEACQAPRERPVRSVPRRYSGRAEELVVVAQQQQRLAVSILVLEELDGLPQRGQGLGPALSVGEHRGVEEDRRHGLGRSRPQGNALDRSGVLPFSASRVPRARPASSLAYADR